MFLTYSKFWFSNFITVSFALLLFLRPITVCYYCKNLLVNPDRCKAGAEKLSKSLNGQCDNSVDNFVPKDFRLDFMKNASIQKYKRNTKEQSIQTVEEMYGGMTR